MQADRACSYIVRSTDAVTQDNVFALKYTVGICSFGFVTHGAGVCVCVSQGALEANICQNIILKSNLEHEYWVEFPADYERSSGDAFARLYKTQTGCS